RPAQNTLPLPRITSTRSSAATGACRAAIISFSSSLSRALRFSGRFIQTVLTGPSFSMMTLFIASLRFDASSLDLGRPPGGLFLDVGGKLIERQRRDLHAALRHGL